MKRFAVLALAACTTPAADAQEHASVARTAIIGGRASGEDEDAAVYLEAVGEEDTLRCSGRIVAPGLVMTARHCVIKRKLENVQCNPDGTPVDDGVGTEDMSLEPPEHITVFVGAHRSVLRAVAVRQVMVDLQSSLCSGDLAFVVLAEAGLDVRTPLRRAAVRVGEELLVTGWGYTSDARDKLPLDRATLDAIPVSAVGPGLLPPGTFAVDGNTLCLGDSGAVALIDGAVVGVYSTISPSPDQCTSPGSKNLFQGIAGQADLVARAFEAIGETPWYVDPPDAGVSAGVSDAGVGEGDAGELASSSAAPSSPPSGEGCAMTRPTGRAGISALLAGGALLACARRRRAANTVPRC